MSKDIQYLAQLRDYYARHRVLPSFSGIARLVGLKTTSAVSAMVGRLKAEGFLDSTPDKRLQPGKRFFERECLNTVRAGLPAPADEAPADAFTLDEHLIPIPSRTVMLKVKGDSMKDAGLMPGDTVLVLKGAPTKPGDIVVAVVDNEFTVKYLEADKKGEFFLKAGNVAYPHIRPRESLELYGKVIGSFRKY